MYAQTVKDHWRVNRPRAWAAMTPSQQSDFARNLSQQIEQEIDNLAAEQESLIPAGLPYERKVARLALAWAQAERQVLAEMLLPAEDEGETEA